MASYVGQYGNGWVVLVNDKWYGPGCVLNDAVVWPNLDSIVWTDLVAAQNCYNAKIGGGGGGGGTTPPGTDPVKGIETFFREHFTTVLLVGGVVFGARLLMGGKRR